MSSPEYARLGELILNGSRLYNTHLTGLPFLTVNGHPLLVDYTTEVGENGIEYLRFSTVVSDENIDLIRCESVLVESSTKREYVIKAIDRQGEDVSVECQLDLIDLCGSGLNDTIVLDGNAFWQNNHYRIDSAIRTVLRSAGWSFTWQGGVSDTLYKSELSDEYTGTPFDIVQTILGQVDIVCTFDQAEKRCTGFDPYCVEADQKLVLNEKINLSAVDCKSSSYDLVTRIFPLGNNLDVAPVNNGKYYVDNFSYTDRIIAAEWGCTDYNTPSGLLSAAKQYLRKACVPSESYDLKLIDLYEVDNNNFPFLKFEMGSVAFYYDALTKSRKRMQVTKITRRPYRPEETSVEITYRAEDTGPVHSSWR